MFSYSLAAIASLVNAVVSGAVAARVEVLASGQAAGLNLAWRLDQAST